MGDNEPLPVIERAVPESEAVAVDDEFDDWVFVELGGGGGGP